MKSPDGFVVGNYRECKGLMLVHRGERFLHSSEPKRLQRVDVSFP